MIRNRLGLHLNTLKGGRDARHLALKIKAAAEAGFSGVTLDLEDIQKWVGSDKHLRDLRHLLKEHNLEVFGVGDVPVCEGDGGVADPAGAFAAAVALGAPVVGAIYNNMEADLARARRDWAEFVEMAGDAEGVRPALHFRGDSPRFNSLNEAWDIVSDGPPGGCLLLDLYDFWRGESTASSLELVPPELIRTVYLSDVGNVEREKATDDDRIFPGEGIMPLTHIISTLGRRGYEGSFAVKALHGAEREPCSKRAARAFSAAKRLLGTSGPSHRKQPAPARNSKAQ